jgi:uncharacterized protein
LQPFLDQLVMPKKKNAYQIEFGGLKNGWHDFQFDINETFFDEDRKSEMELSIFHFSIDCRLEKQSTLIVLELSLKGYLDLSCDRCLIAYKHPIQHEERMVVKFASVSEQVHTEELIEIPFGEHQLKLDHVFYEMLLLALPMKRIKPDCKSNAKTCDINVLKKLEDFIPEEKNDNTDPDSPWSVLKNIKFNQN